ncbi:MAG: response regulator [Proteobacteria bacterium]|nr:response regulator [Pseudomonadota bacterium]
MEKKVLIVDDDAKLRSLLVKYLEGYGFKTSTLADGSMVLQTIETESPDIVILDIMLGNENGLDVLKDIRRHQSVPVVMLTAKGEETDRIVGLELGADDYLPKPFNPRELLARMNSVLRRSTLDTKSGVETGEKSLLHSGELVLNTAKRILLVGEKEIALSSTEYRIIRALMTHPNTVYSRDELMNIARGKDFMAFDRSIDVHISNLRAKIEAVSPDLKKRIKTVWGTGYMLEEEE